MSLRAYFEGKKGYGIISTADENGLVNSAIYSMPYLVDDETVAFLMSERQTHANLSKNPHAAYMFIDFEGRFQGKRLSLTKVKEETSGELFQKLLDGMNYPGSERTKQAVKYVVYFKVTKELPLVGATSL